MKTVTVNYYEVPQIFKKLKIKALPVLKNTLPNREELIFLNLNGLSLNVTPEGDMVLKKGLN